jgi:hypothetical protein
MTALPVGRDGSVEETMRVVNAIPYGCDAPPGLVSATDLPPTLPHGAFDGVTT